MLATQTKILKLEHNNQKGKKVAIEKHMATSSRTMPKSRKIWMRSSLGRLISDEGRQLSAAQGTSRHPLGARMPAMMNRESGQGGSEREGI